MKRMILLLAALLLLGGNAAALSLPQEVGQFVPQELWESAERGGDILVDGAAGLWETIRDGITEAVKESVRSALALMLLALLCGAVDAFCGAFAEGHARTYLSLFAVLASSLLCFDALSGLIAEGQQTLEALETLASALLPTVAMAMAAGGCVHGASVWQAGTLLGCEVLLRVQREVLLPLLYAYVGLAAAGEILPESHLDGMAETLKKGINWALCALASVFTAYLTISRVLSGTADQLTVKTGKMLVSGTVPVVGAILSDAAEAVLAGAGALRGTLGALGVFAVLSVSILPMLHLAVQYLLFQAAAFFSAMCGIPALRKYIEQLGGAFASLLAMTACAALFLLVALLVAMTVVIGA